MLIRHLPPGSALHREMDPEGSGWDVTDYLLANVIDVLDAANWQRANAGKKTASRKPAPFYRPRTPGAVRRPSKSFEQRVAEWKARHCGREEVS